MIVYQHSETGELMRHHRSPGADWQVVADPAPDDFGAAPYVVEAGQLVPDLAAARAKQRTIINAARDAAQDGGAMTPFGPMDSNERSRQLLNGAVSAAQIALANAEPFTVTWTLADDSAVTLTAADTITAGLAVAAHVASIHERARVLKARIAAATSFAAIAAITWSIEDPA
jgi:hypothetical protein